MLQGRAVHGEDAGVGGFGWWSGSCGNSVQWVAAVVVQPVCRSFNCWGLHKSSEVPPELRAGFSCLVGAVIGGGGARDVP